VGVRGRTAGAELAARDPLPNPPLFKGIGDSTISAASSGKALIYRGFTQWPPPFPPRFDRERIAKLPQILGENEGTLFAGRSTKGWINDAPPGPRLEKAETW
jgi:hypothetical protein